MTPSIDPGRIDELDDFFGVVEHRRKTLTVYSAAGDEGLIDQFATRNATVSHRPLPEGSSGFVVVCEDGEFVGSIATEGLTRLLSPPLVRPWDETLISEGYRALFEALDETLFASFDRRQLLFTTREIEERAWRVGHGTLSVCFQRSSAMDAQVPVYERFADETDLDIHVYVSDDWSPPEIEGVTAHAEAADEIGTFWLLAFDGGGNDDQACTLLAEERPEGFYGFWSYDPELVTELLAYLKRTYG